MNVLIIPSWYPSEKYPSTGIFFKEQAQLLARHRPDWSVGISIWGSHDPRLWLRWFQPLNSLLKFGSKPVVKQKDTLLESNCVEFLSPAFTWTRKWRDGNIKGILEANEQNLKRHIDYFGKPDIIHAQVTYPGGYIAKHLSEIHDIPYVITEHQSPFPMASLKKLLTTRLIPTLKSANKVFGVSRALVDQLSSHGVDANYMANFIDDLFFSPKKSENNPPTLIAVGRLEEQKNYPLMLQALAGVQQKHPFHLKIVGEGPLRKKLSRHASQLRLSAEWLGECHREDVKHHLQSADIFINTSLHENQPVAILEALACGLPVVTTPWSGADEIIHPDIGVISSDWAPESFSQVLSDSFNKFTASEVRAYFDEHFATDKTIAQLESAYRSVI